MHQYEMSELTVSGPVLREHWAKAEVSGAFTHESGECVEVKGFYAGNGEYKIRFLPEKSGCWRYNIVGTVQASGTLVCESAVSGGPVRTVGTGFFRADGTCFHPFGTTIYALMHQSEALIDGTMETLKTAPFNKVRLCVFPKHFAYNTNDPDYFPFEKNADGSWDLSRPSFAFWEHFETRLRQLYELGIEADVILFHPYDCWGFATMTREENLLYLDYLIRRLAAFPHVWWSLANEYDVGLGYKSQGDWEELEEFVATNDPYKHPLSNHNMIKFWDATRPNISHASLQTGRIAEVPYFLKQYGKPVIVDECCYEGNILEPWGAISGREMTYRFWRTICGGGYCTHGETFLDDQDVLWWSKGGVLRGESPSRIGFLRGIVETLLQPLEPSPEPHLATATAEEINVMIQTADAQEKGMLMAIAQLPAVDRLLSNLVAHTYSAHCGDNVFLTFYDIRTSKKAVLKLPENGGFRVDVIDVWEMTRETVLTGVSGTVEVPLPGKEGIAVMARRESE